MFSADPIIDGRIQIVLGLLLIAGLVALVYWLTGFAKPPDDDDSDDDDDFSAWGT